MECVGPEVWSGTAAERTHRQSQAAGGSVTGAPPTRSLAQLRWICATRLGHPTRIIEAAPAGRWRTGLRSAYGSTGACSIHPSKASRAGNVSVSTRER